VKNSLKSDESAEGTQIVDRAQFQSGHGMEEMQVVGVTSDSSKVWLKVQLTRPSVLSAIWAAAAQSHLSLVAAQFVDGSVRAFVEQESVAEWKKLLAQLAAQGFVASFELNDEWVPVSVVGDRFSQDGSALQKVFEVLSSAGVEVGTGNASALAITIAVPKSRVDEAVSSLHSALVKGNS
jgi:aspartokinase